MLCSLGVFGDFRHPSSSGSSPPATGLALRSGIPPLAKTTEIGFPCAALDTRSGERWRVTYHKDGCHVAKGVWGYHCGCTVFITTVAESNALPRGGIIASPYEKLCLISRAEAPYNGGGGVCGSVCEFLWGWGVWPGVDRVAPGDQTMVSGWRKSGQSFLLPPLTGGVTDPAILTQPAFSGERSGMKSIHYSYPAYAETRNLKQ